MAVLELLVMLLVINGAPILTRNLVRDRFLVPLDGGAYWQDGRRVLGPSKTVPGLLSALALAVLTATLFDYSLGIGLLIGIGAMAGDLLSSFIKRRMGFQSSDCAAGLDQIPESLLPALLVMTVLQLTLAEVILIVAAFVATDLGLSVLLHRLNLRRQPY